MEVLEGALDDSQMRNVKCSLMLKKNKNEMFSHPLIKKVFLSHENENM